MEINRSNFEVNHEAGFVIWYAKGRYYFSRDEKIKTMRADIFEKKYKSKMQAILDKGGFKRPTSYEDSKVLIDICNEMKLKWK